ncbi:hypothetical protein KJ359_000813 [Pestalotiopsis sp. 9143b]|nr:hypothetical protein KJ359_000813 [Pestalotiopsis sp. 9143b]
MHYSPGDLRRIAEEAEAKICLMEMEGEARLEKWQHIMNEDIGYPDGIPVANLDHMDDYIDKSTAYIYERRIYANADREPKTRTAATRNVLETSSDPNLDSNSQKRNQRDSVRKDPDDRLESGSKLVRPSEEKENILKQVMPPVNNEKHITSVSAPGAKYYELERPKATPVSCRIPCEMKSLQNPWFLGNLSPPTTIHSDDEEKSTAQNTNPSNSTTVDSDDDDTTPYSRLPKGQHPLPPLPPRNTHTQENRRESTTENEMEVDIDDSWQIQVDEKGYRPTKRRRRDGENGKN